MEKEILPIIQTHTFNVRPYFPFTQGYAPFLVSTSFDGSEKVTFSSLDTDYSPAISYQLNEYSQGKWYLNDKDRFLTATSGPLQTGQYQFAIQKAHAQPKKIVFPYEPHYIECVGGIEFQRSGTELRIEWMPPNDADSFWVFLLPADSKNFLEDLIPITKNQFIGVQTKLDLPKISKGPYRCVMRANRMWKHPTIHGFLSESWSISELTFHVP